MVCLLTHPSSPQAHTALLVPSRPTCAPLDTTARRQPRFRSNALLVGIVRGHRWPQFHAPRVPTPRPCSRSPPPPASPAQHATSGRLRQRCATPPRTGCARPAPTSRSGRPSSRPTSRAPGCATAGTTATRAPRAWRDSGASPGSPTAARPTARRLRSRARRTRACVRQGTLLRVLLRVQALARCANPARCALARASSRWKSNRPLSPTSPPSSCSCSSHCRWRITSSRCS